MSERVALITGASAGIGAEFARLFAAKGHRVALVARRVEALEALANEIVAKGGAQPIVIGCDLSQPSAGEAVAAALAAAAAEVEYLVNNAGYGLFGDAVKLDKAEQLNMIEVNVGALTDLTLRFTDQLIRHRGGIINLASIASFLPGPGMAVYYATKAYVLSFSEALHVELGSRGVRVTAVCPGPVPTEFQKRAGFRPGLDSMILNVTAVDVAALGYNAVMSGKRLVLPGLLVRMIPFFLRLAPRSVVLAAAGAIQRKR